MTDTVTTTSAAAMAAFMELSPDPVAIVDHEGRIRAVNAPLLALSKHSEADLLAGTIEILVPAALRTRHVRTRQSYVHTPSMRPMGDGRELSILTADGEEIAVDIALQPLSTADGMRFAAVIRDVSAARATKARLNRTQGELRGTIEAMQDGIAVMKAGRNAAGELLSLTIEFANQAAAQILRVPQDDLIGADAASFSGRSAGSLDGYDDLLRTGEPMAHITEWRDPASGDLAAVLEVRGAKVDTDRVVVTFRDVLDQRVASEQVHRMNQELRLANEALGAAAEFQRDFISASSHELRTPLTAMTGFAELLVDRWDQMTDPRRRGAAEAILRNARRQLQLVDDLAHAAHLQSGRLQLQLTEVDLHQILAEAVISVAGGEAFTMPTDRSVRVVADEGRLLQVVINLVSNALRYGKPDYRVEVITPDDGTVHVCVDDHGPGVPDGFAPQLFDAFAQASRGIRREAKGTGLGLYISKSLTDAMGASLTYERTPAGATRFRLTLPVAEASSAP